MAMKGKDRRKAIICSLALIASTVCATAQGLSGLGANWMSIWFNLIEHHLTVKNLQPNTQYYWRVVAQELGDVRSQSSVQTFRTTG